MKSALAEQNQFESYWHWMWEKERKDGEQTVQQKEKGFMVNNTKRSSQKEVEHAMMNPDNYLAFITSKGYGVDRETVVQKRV